MEYPAEYPIATALVPCDISPAMFPIAIASLLCEVAPASVPSAIAVGPDALFLSPNVAQVDAPADATRVNWPMLLPTYTSGGSVSRFTTSSPGRALPL